MEYVGENSIKKLSSLIKSDIAQKQDKITAEGLLQGDGEGNITVANTIQSKRTTKAIADVSEEVLKDGEIIIIRSGEKPYDTTLRVGDGTKSLKDLKEVGTKYNEATSTSSGLMSSSDKTKLDGIEEGANKTVVDSSLSSTSINPVQNKVVDDALGLKLSLSGGMMTGTVTTKGIKLTSGIDYGESLPSSPATDQLFFQTVSSNFILDNVYPVGAIYMSMNSTNPGTLFGGTWERVEGKFLLGVSSNYPAGSSGGEATHTLTISEMPSHKHRVIQARDYDDIPDNFGGSGAAYGFVAGDSDLGNIGTQYDMYSSAVGGSTSHNNMPPYLAVYIWYRTA